MVWPNRHDDDMDAPQEMDLADEGADLDMMECPICRESIPEGIARCPHCGQWLFGDTPARRRATGWFWPLMVALLVAIILVLWHGLGR